MQLAVLFLLPPLFVFGLYHLMTWGDIFRINQRAYWKRVALASAIGHAVLASGFFVYLYLDYRQGVAVDEIPADFGVFLFGRSDFRWIGMLFDTGAMAAIAGFFSILDHFDAVLPKPAAWTAALFFAVGSLQWYLIGGGVGALIGRFWSGLKTGDDEEWFT